MAKCKEKGLQVRELDIGESGDTYACTSDLLDLLEDFRHVLPRGPSTALGGELPESLGRAMNYSALAVLYGIVQVLAVAGKERKLSTVAQTR